ncbi:MAG: type II secretion system protein [Erysipelotrichales bacterium]|nr:type II secretion system protein [Erysipelotrichales bacterium]
MKNKGFTLVELLAVISIMGVVMVLFLPTMLAALRNGKNLLKKYDLEGVEDAGKMYAADLDNGVITYTYTGDEDIEVNGKIIKPNTELKGYDLKVYLIEKGPIEVTMETLVAGDYYDKNCKYATNPGEKDKNCHLPKTCTLSIGLEHTLSKDGLYYVTTGYTSKIVRGCE